MSQVAGVDLDASVGYVLKRASSGLHAAMEAALRPAGLNVTQYSCLELLAQRPGLSSSDLARGAFVSRQSMHVVLQGLQRDGLVARPDAAPVGRALPTELTALGRARLAEATVAVRAVEREAEARLDPRETVVLRSLLLRYLEGLRG